MSELRNYTVVTERGEVSFVGTGYTLGTDNELWIEYGDENVALFAPGSWLYVSLAGEGPAVFHEECSIQIPNDLDYEITADMDIPYLAEKYGWPTVRRYVTDWIEDES